MTDAEYMVILTETGEHLKKMIAAEHPSASKTIDATLKLLGGIERQKRGLAKTLSGKGKVVGKAN